MKGVLRTRVGYAGGTHKDPVYHRLGDHSETIEVTYDPSMISYEQLLQVFWEGHEPTVRSWSRQYMSIIFVHSEAQRRLAVETKAREEAERGRKIHTEIVSVREFYPAEDYHQKYYVRRYSALVRELESLSPGSGDFTDTTAAARINGYLGGGGTIDDLKEELACLSVPAAKIERIVTILKGATR